ncbi:MAG: hypothetical protein JWP02_664 [Acidimicrobiales bacterium]|nr:hypothetical protein [Acidimicrobiales bacterium]
MSTRKAVVAALGAATLVAGAGGMAVAQLSPVAGPGAPGGAGGGGGAGGAVGFSGNAGCGPVNVATGVGIITRSGSSCGRVSGKNSVKNAANGGKGGNGGNGGRGGNGFNRF